MAFCKKHGRFADDEGWCPDCPPPPAVCHECGGPVEGKVSFPGDCEVYTCDCCHEAAGEHRCDWCGKWGKNVWPAGHGESYHIRCAQAANVTVTKEG